MTVDLATLSVCGAYITEFSHVTVSRFGQILAKVTIFCLVAADGHSGRLDTLL